MAQILIIDDDAAFREGLSETLNDLGYSTFSASDVVLGSEIFREQEINLILLDYQMPRMDGLSGISHLRALKPKIPIALITADSSSSVTIEAMKSGAQDYLNKPVTKEKLARLVETLLDVPNEKTLPIPRQAAPVPYELKGQSEAMKTIQKTIGRIAHSRSPVLIQGETGTGKELIARAIHAHSMQAKGPFLAINCAAIPENLLESELFGHVKGAFTGALHERLGAFRSAQNGTIFLDEIGDMPILLQAKILRVLQESEVTPLGSSKPIPINARIVSATHQNLGQKIKAKEFREDLYYRLNVIEILIPPLRERRDDLRELIHFFAQSRPVSEEAAAKLMNHSWPGNVRELQNVIERASLASQNDLIESKAIRFLTLPSQFSATSALPSELNLPEAVADLEKNLIAEALKRSSGNRSEAARILGIQRQLLYSKLKDYQLDHTK